MSSRYDAMQMVQAPFAAARAFVCPSTEPKAWSPNVLLDDAITGHTPPPRPPVSPP